MPLKRTMTTILFRLMTDGLPWDRLPWPAEAGRGRDSGEVDSRFALIVPVVSVFGPQDEPPRDDLTEAYHLTVSRTPTSARDIRIHLPHRRRFSYRVLGQPGRRRTEDDIVLGYEMHRVLRDVKVVGVLRQGRGIDMNDNQRRLL
jgi:hypothetical protein